MTLGQRQELFSKLLAQFIIQLYDIGFAVRMGQVERTPEQQEIYIKKGLSKTKNSTHLIKLAADLYLFYKGEYIDGNTPEEQQHLFLSGQLWEKICHDAGATPEWGGRFGAKDTISLGWDANHYGIKNE